MDGREVVGHRLRAQPNRRPRAPPESCLGGTPVSLQEVEESVPAAKDPDMRNQFLVVRQAIGVKCLLDPGRLGGQALEGLFGVDGDIGDVCPLKTRPTKGE